MTRKKIEEKKFQIELEVVDTRKQDGSKRTIRSAEKNLRRLVLSRINGKTGEC